MTRIGNPPKRQYKNFKFSYFLYLLNHVNFRVFCFDIVKIWFKKNGSKTCQKTFSRVNLVGYYSSFLNIANELMVELFQIISILL
jgi:hypothetical protein